MIVFTEGPPCGRHCPGHQRHNSGTVNKTGKVSFLMKLTFWGEGSRGRRGPVTEPENKGIATQISEGGGS